MKLIITTSSPYSLFVGAYRSNIAVAEQLAARGHQVEFISPAGKQPVGEQQLAGVTYHLLPSAGLLLPVLNERIQALQPDAVLVSSEDTGQAVLAAALKAAPGRVIYLAQTPSMLPFGPESYAPDVAKARLVRDCAGIISISHFTADYVRAHSGLNVFVNHPPHFGRTPFQKLNDPDGHIFMMSASEMKGVQIFIDLARRMPDQKFAIVTSYATKPKDIAALRQLPNVRLLSNDEDTDRLYAGARLLLVPTLWMEGFGMVSVDAMVRGIPVIASDYAGLREASLGVARLVPIRPIVDYSSELDENLLPIPVIPAQDIEPWVAAVRAVAAPDVYDAWAAQSRATALAFVESLRIEPTEAFIQDAIRQALPAQVLALPADSTASHQAQRRDAIARLSPAAREALFSQLAIIPARSQVTRISTLNCASPDGALGTMVLPHAVGGDFSSMGDLIRALRQRWNLVMIQSLAADADRSDDSLPATAARYLADVRAVVAPGAPLVFAGWSAGGIWAYEMACQAADAGLPVGAVALLDSQLAHTAIDHENPDFAAQDGPLIEMFMADIEKTLGLDAPLYDAAMSSLPKSEQEAAVIERLRGLPGLLVDERDAQRYLEMLRLFIRNYRLLANYVPRRLPETVPGMVCVYAEKSHFPVNPDVWDPYAPNTRRTDLFVWADHYSLIASPTVHTVGNLLAQSLCGQPAA